MNIRSRRGRHPGNGQASLEMTVALIGALLFLLGSVKVCLWLNERMVERHEEYRQTRREAGSSNPGKAWNEPSKPLDIFGQSQ